MSNTHGDQNSLDSALWLQALDAAQDIWFITEPTGKILAVNAKLCTVLKRPKESISGSSFIDFVSREDEVFFSRALRSIVVNRRSERITVTLKGTGADALTFEALGTPLLKNGEVAAVSFAGRDISQEIVLEQKLWDTLDERNRSLDFALRTSLGLVRGYVYTLDNSEKMNPEQRKRYMRVVLDEMDNLARTVDNLLDCRRLEESVYEMEPEVTDLKEVLTMAMAQYREEAVRREIDIKIAVPETMAPLYAPREAVHRVLSNLIENAIHHTLHSGRIDIEFSDGDDYVDITVQDYGAGIAEADLPYIFEKYYRSNNTGYSAQGTNLGLAITRMLVNAMAGEIWVTSEMGKGARFKVMLPRRFGSSADALINEAHAHSRNENMPDAPATI